MKNNTNAKADQGFLDRPLIVTQFSNLGAMSKQTLRLSSRELATKVERATATHKRTLELLSGVIFGAKRTEKRSLRSRANAKVVRAVFVDYDLGEISPEEAAEIFREAGVAALIYTTPSHGKLGKGNRWRAVFVLSAPQSPDDYADLVARVNGLLDGALADESFDVWQSYYFGSVKGQKRVQTYLVEGDRCLDEADDLEAGSIGPSYPSSAIMNSDPTEAEDQSNIPGAVEHAKMMLDWSVRYILDSVKNGQSRTRAIYKQAFHLGGYVACATLSEEDVCDALWEAAEEVAYLPDYPESELERHISKGLSAGVERPLPWRDPLDLLHDPETNEGPDTDKVNSKLAELDIILEWNNDDDSSTSAKPTRRPDRVTARLNDRYALVRHNANTYIAEFNGDKVDLGPVEKLHQFFANDLVPTGMNGGVEPASKHWLRSPERRSYPGGIVFDPKGDAPQDALNLFTGFALEPDPLCSCERIIAHIRDVVASGNEEHFWFIVCWLAHLVQNPGEKPGIAIVLRGRKGVGKDTVAVIIGKILGMKYIAHITRPDDLTGRFNAPFATALLVHVEESYWSGDQSKKGTLQALITAPTMPIERKGIDRIEVESFLRLMMTTNEGWAVPASEDERRYAVFDVSDQYRLDDDWFGPLYDEINGSGAAAFLDYLLKIDLSDFNIRDVPQTDALRDQKIKSLRGVQRWWFDMLYRGDEAIFGDGVDGLLEVGVEKEFVRDHYHSALREKKFFGSPVDAQEFTKQLKELTGGLLNDKRPRTDGGRVRMFVIPDLETCRSEFEEWLGAEVKWDIEGDFDPEADALI